MYKVFINQKQLTISSTPIDVGKTLEFVDATTLEIAVDLLENTSCSEINVYGEDVKMILENFKKFCKIVEASGGIVYNVSNNILFIHRFGKWDLPKGKIEKGESIEEAALREVEEETALKELNITDFVGDTYHIYREKDNTIVLKITHWFKMDYNGNQQPVPQIEEGIKKAEWLSYNDIQDKVIPSTFKNIQLILENI